MNYNELYFAAHLLDPIKDQPCVRVSADTMRAIHANESERLNELFFGNKDIVFISRKDIMSIPRKKLEQFTLSCLYWGYPGNNNQRCTYAMNSWAELIGLVRSIRYHRNMPSDYYASLEQTMTGIQNLNISTYSKLFYFSRASVNGYECVILDNQVMTGIGNLNGDEFDNLKQSIIGYNRYRVYPRYLEEMSELARQFHVPAQNIEYVLWLAGHKGL